MVGGAQQCGQLHALLAQATLQLRALLLQFGEFLFVRAQRGFGLAQRTCGLGDFFIGLAQLLGGGAALAFQVAAVGAMVFSSSRNCCSLRSASRWLCAPALVPASSVQANTATASHARAGELRVGCGNGAAAGGKRKFQ